MANVIEEYLENEEENEYLVEGEDFQEFEEIDADAYGFDELDEDDLLGADGENLLDHGEEQEQDPIFENIEEFGDGDLQGLEQGLGGAEIGAGNVDWKDSRELGSPKNLEGIVEEIKSSDSFQDTLSRENLVDHGEREKAVVGEKTVDDVLTHASNSYVFADKLDVVGDVGLEASGSVLAARDLNVWNHHLGEGIQIGPKSGVSGLKVITGPDSTPGVTYTGDWGRLQRFLDVNVPQGRFDFEYDLREEIPSVDVLENELKVLNELQDLEENLKSGKVHSETPKRGLKALRAYQEFRKNEEEFYGLTGREDFQDVLRATPVMKKWLDTEMPNIIDDLDSRNRDIMDEARLVKKLSSKSSPDHRSGEAVRKLYRNDRNLLYELEDEYEGSDFLIESLPTIESDMGLSPREFLGTFSGGDPDRVLGEGFESTDPVGSGYEEGLEKLESLARIEGNYDTEINYDRVVHDVLGEDLTSEIDLESAFQKAEKSGEDVEAILFGDELGQLIGRKMEENPEEGQELVEKRNELKEQLEEEKREAAFQETIYREISDPELRERAYREVKNSENPELDFLSPNHVRRMLDTLASEHLSENSSAYHDAERLSRDMDGRSVSFEVYDKSLESMPYQEDRHIPCTFPGSYHDKSTLFLNYMLDPATQVGKIETDKGDGVALMKLVEHDGDDFLYVHSVEAEKGDNIASDRAVANTIQDQIEDYAQEVLHEEHELMYEDGAVKPEGILYSMDRHNNGTPQNFQEVLMEDEEYSVQEVELGQLGLEHNSFDHDLSDGVKVYQKAL